MAKAKVTPDTTEEKAEETQAPEVVPEVVEQPKAEGVSAEAMAAAFMNAVAAMQSAQAKIPRQAYDNTHVVVKDGTQKPLMHNEVVLHTRGETKGE